MTAKRILSAILAMALVLGCISLPSFAQEVAPTYPDLYLNDGMDKYVDEQIRQMRPKVYHTVCLPRQDRTFNYSFSEDTKKVYSNFIISPQDAETGISIEYTSMHFKKPSHTIELKLYKKGENEPLFSQKIDVSDNAVGQIYIEPSKLSVNAGYYIELSSPSLPDASGEIEVSSGRMTLSDYYYSDSHDCWDIQAYNIEKHEDATITFQVFRDIIAYNFTNKNTFVIDADTYIYDNNSDLEKKADLDKFASGERLWITFYSSKTDYSDGDGIIHVDAIESIPEAVSYTGGDTQAQAFDTLEKYGIIEKGEDGTFGGERNITRGEMAMLAGKCLGFDDGIAAGENFSDVPSGHKYHNFILLAKGFGIMHGVGNNIFVPDEFVTNEQAVKTVVTMLGYEPRAKEMGGYPMGYTMVAQQLGLLEELELDMSAAATLENIARLLARSIKTPVMEQTTYGSNPVYTVLDGQNGVVLKTLETKTNYYGTK